MARTPFKRWSAQWVPASVERSTYVLASSVALALLMAFWQPLPAVLWAIGPPGSWLLSSLAVGGLTLIAVASVQIDFAELFGLRQAMSADAPSVPFQEPGLYRFVRHPLMVGLLLALWAAPSMTVGRLFFNATMTAYILVAIRWEEGDLLERFGEAYADYRRRVPALVPGLGRGGVEKVVR
jgi:protein-S-isoprenylcysteine O-methyltransferase Ste14